MEDSKNPDNEGYYQCASTYEELEEKLRQHEIRNVVRFASVKGGKTFNTGAEPWKDFKGSLSAPKLLWSSDLVPTSDAPYIAVARKAYQCQYGKQRHSRVSKDNPLSYKIGCPCTVEFIEVLRLTNPKVRKAANGSISTHHRRELTINYRINISKFKHGQPHELEFKREFHLHMSPLSSHVHVTGEGAAKHQRIDPKLSEKIHELAASGITATDVIQDHLVHYVEEELFKGQELPLKTNRRFYPTLRDILNHTYLGKNFKKKMNEIQLSESDLAVTSITDDGVIYHETGETVEVGRYESVEQYEQMPEQQAPDFEQNMYFGNSDFAQYSTQNQNQSYSGASSSTNAATQKSVAKYKTTELTTRRRKGGKRTPKERFLALVKKLYRIANAVDSSHDMAKVTASLINTIVLAKPMVPEDKKAVLFQEDPRPYAYPKRIRTYKKKPPIPRKRRHPEMNPDATQHPDRKALKREAKLKKEAEIKAKRAEQLAESQRRRAEEAEKRKSLPQGPPAKVLIVSDSREPVRQSPAPPTLKPGTRIMLASNNTGFPQASKGAVSLLSDSNVPKVMFNPSTQSLIGMVKPPLSTSNLVVGTAGTPLQSLGIITKKRDDSSPKGLHVSYNSILPKPDPGGADVISSTASSSINKVVNSSGNLVGHLIFPNKSVASSTTATASSVVSSLSASNSRVVTASANTGSAGSSGTKNNMLISLLQGSSSVVKVTPLPNNNIPTSSILISKVSPTSAIATTNASSSHKTPTTALVSLVTSAAVNPSMTSIKTS